MRAGFVGLAAVVTAGCYSPVFPEHVACGDNGSCPVGQVCFDGFCDVTAPDHDADPGDRDGASDGPSGGFATPTLVPELSSQKEDFAPSLSVDQREVFLNSDRNGSFTIFVATRASTSEAFGTPAVVAAANMAQQIEYDPEISRDQCELIFVSEGTQTSLRRLARPSPTGAWGLMFLLPIPSVEGPSLTAGDLRMMLKSAGGIAEYERMSLLSPWMFLRDHQTLDNHAYPGVSTDGLELFSTRGGRLHRATRGTLDDEFGTPERILFGGAFDMFDVEDPELSVDGRTMYMSANAGSGYDIYVTTR